MNPAEALIEAAKRGKARKVREILQTGVSPDERDASQRTALHWASQEGYVDVVRALIKGGGAVNVTDHLGFTPLATAAGEGHEKIVRELLESGASARITSFSNADATPLHTASAWNRQPVVKLLVERSDAEINAKDSYGKTALTHALENGNDAIASYLAGHGATV